MFTNEIRRSSEGPGLGSRRVKVFVLIKGLGVGGAENLQVMSLPYLNRDKFEYEYGYLLPWKNTLAPQLEAAGFPVFCLNHRRAFDVTLGPKLIHLLRQRKVDLLHLHLPYTGIVGRLVSRFTPTKAVVYTEHNLWERYHGLTYQMNRLTYGWNDAVIAVSTDVERSIRHHYKHNGRLELRTILNGVDVAQLASVSRDPLGVKAEFGIPEHHRLVVHVANFTPKKRHEDLLKAAQLVTQADPATTFLLVGQGPLETAMKEEAHRLGVQDHVLFAGFRPDAPRLIAAGDVFVMSSQYEGLPVSLLEAMALGRPLVLTAVGGVREVVTDGVEGLLLEPLNPGLLAEKILAVLASPELQERFSQNAIKRVRDQFGVERMVRQTESLYDSVLGAGCNGDGWAQHS